jgi:hypothetical protein
MNRKAENQRENLYWKMNRSTQRFFSRTAIFLFIEMDGCEIWMKDEFKQEWKTFDSFSNIFNMEVRFQMRYSSYFCKLWIEWMLALKMWVKMRNFWKIFKNFSSSLTFFSSWIVQINFSDYKNSLYNLLKVVDKAKQSKVS